MTSCTLPNGQDTTFTYGADGLRRSMTVTQGSSSLTTNYVYDGTMMIREMQLVTGSLVSSATYLQGASGPAYRRNDLTGSIPHWYVYNGLGSVVGEVDPAGNYTASQEYDVYGNVRTNTQTGTFDTRQGYVGGLGHQTDPETGGLIYMQARYYDPSVWRFVSEDPGRNGKNWFIYCSDSPNNICDSDGCSGQGVNFAVLVAGIELLKITICAVLLRIPSDFVWVPLVGAGCDLIISAAFGDTTKDAIESAVKLATGAWVAVAATKYYLTTTKASGEVGLAVGLVLGVLAYSTVCGLYASTIGCENT